jgi:tetratricopeptide (TPR) repeat protein
MKILLFNLGSVEFRILDWGIEGFNSLFEQDIILWGPIPDKKFTYKDKEIPILSFFEPTTIKDVFSKLPKDWYPDVVTCETSVLNYITDIYLCPVKTILFTRDAWSDTIFNRGLVEQFDFINHAAIDRSLYNVFNVKLLPLSNCAVSIHGAGLNNSEYEKREIDVISIATFNRSFYHERYRNFYNLSALNKTGIKIKYFLGIKQAELYTYYQRSKIVIDWAHTLSNRSYEAAMNGCLLFSHEDNQLMKDFWIPWEEYIPYNENNVLELVTFYIKNPDQAKRIINNVRQKIQTIPASWGQFVWENIRLANNSDFSVQERIRRSESTPISVLHYRSATPLLYNYDYNKNLPSNWKELYFKRIDDALSASDDINFKISPLIEAARMAFLLKKPRICIEYLDGLQKVLPDYGWIYYFHGRIYFEQGENDNALQSLQKAIKCGLKAPELLQRFVLPVIEKGNTCDFRRIINYLWQSVHKHNNEFQVRSFMHLAFELSGEIYQRIQKTDNAINSYIEAINYVPIPDCIYKVNPLLIQSMEYGKMLNLTDIVIDDSPYDSILILYKAYALIQLKRNRIAYMILKEHKEALKSFKKVRKIVFIRNSISFILPFVLIGRYFNSKIIIELIKILKNRLGFIYLG